MHLARSGMSLVLGAIALSAVAGPPMRRAHGPMPMEAIGDPYPSTYRVPRSAPVVLVGATILDGAGQRFDNGEVILADGKVRSIGHDLPRPAGAMVIDAHGRWITPGLIDVHTHLGVYSLPETSLDTGTSDVTELRDPNAADTWVEHAVRTVDPGFSHALAAGVTTLQILPGSSALFGGRSVIVHPIAAATIAAMKFPGAAQGLKMACGASPKEEFAERHLLNSRQGEIAAMREAFAEAENYVHQEGQEHGHEHHGPAADDLRDQTLALVLQGKMPVHIHC
ncbi:MAG: amidohydrolase, partial [Sphingomonas sp.]|nr:amidohydrolase [Sphingomonas sp.]